MLELPTNRLQSLHQPSKQLLLHKVPIRFPVPSNLMESIETLMFINDALISLVDDLPSDALIDATPLNRVDSHQARTAVVLTFDTEQTRNRVLRAIRERRANTAILREANFYFTDMPRRSRARHQTHTEDELQEMRNEAMKSREERPTGKAKKSSKDKPKAVTLASKVKKKYSHLNATAKKRREKVGSVFTGTKTKKGKLSGGSVNAASTPITGTNMNTIAEDLSTLVQEIWSVVPRSRIDTLQTPEPAESNMRVEIENDLYESPHPEGYGPESTHQNDDEAERRKLEEECLREETKLIENIERFRSRVNSDGDLRDTMRPKSGRADLRNSILNRDTDTRELMRPRPGPSDLRYSNLQPNKELREIMKPKTLSEPEEGEVESSEEESCHLPTHPKPKSITQRN